MSTVRTAFAESCGGRGALDVEHIVLYPGIAAACTSLLQEPEI
jgi:hypothetical protein